MQKSYTLLVMCFFALVLMTGCKNSGAADDSNSSIPVSFTSVKESDTTSFKRSNGETCQVLVDVSVTYPKSFKDKAATLELQKLFIRTVLEGNDSLSISDAIKDYTSSLLDENSADEENENESEEMEGTPSNKIVFAINITVAYQQNNIVTICKEETVKKDGVPSKTHRYFNFDLEKVCLIDLKMFKDDAISDVCQALKNKLMEQNKATSADELNDLGYFNIDNLTVTTNFCFDENGITWSFLPQELAADANLEPKITLDYSTLKQYASDKSVLNRF